MPSLYGQAGNKKIRLEYSRPEYSRLEYSRLEYSRPERARKRAHLTLFLALFGSIWLSLAPIHETSSCCLWTGMGKAPSTMSLLLKVLFLPFKVVDATLEGMPPKRGAYCYAFFFFLTKYFFWNTLLYFNTKFESGDRWLTNRRWLCELVDKTAPVVADTANSLPYIMAENMRKLVIIFIYT